MWWHTRRNQDFVFRRNGRVHLNRPVGRQFSRLLAAEVCASAVVMLDTPCSEVVWRVLATHCIRQFPPSLPLPSVTVCHHISTGLYDLQAARRFNTCRSLTWKSAHQLAEFCYSSVEGTRSSNHQGPRFPAPPGPNSQHPHGSPDLPAIL